MNTDSPNDVQALEKISNEVDESQIKVMLSSQCIKDTLNPTGIGLPKPDYVVAQAFLVDKLRRQADRQREVCNFITSDNTKIEAEIKQAEQEIRSMLMAQDTIKSANVELRKEWLIAKEKKADITERIETGVKKYEALWAQCKERYETIQFVKEYLMATERVHTLDNNIDGLENEEQKILEEIKERTNTCYNLDKQRVLELANFMVNEIPDKIKLINEKTTAINEMGERINDIMKETPSDKVTTAKQIIVETNDEPKSVPDDKNSAPITKNDDDSLIPKLKLHDFDFGAFDVSLNEIKKKKDATYNKTPIDVTIAFETNINYCKEDKTDDFIISPYFRKPIYDDRAQNYAKKKLINILEDIKVDNTEAYNIMSKLNPDKFQTVQEISADYKGPKDKDKEILECEDIEVIDLTSSNADIDSVIIPPTQFLDITNQEINAKDDEPYGGALENISKKHVTFDINENNEDEDRQNETNEQNKTINSQLDVSVASEESFMKIKDMILKKHNLDLSPQFVYGKNNILQKNDEDGEVVTSKFFQGNDNMLNDKTKDDAIDMDVQDDDKVDGELPIVTQENNSVQPQKNANEVIIPMEVDDGIASSPKEKENEGQRSVAGLLFTHGPQGLPDSLNVSISTTGFEDSDFPHCIDSSLLLSPKADIPMTGDNNEVLSQDVPNFLSGLRKAGLSFFGGGPSTSNRESNPQNPGNSFSFNFGGDDKKNRGGLFNMFN